MIIKKNQEEIQSFLSDASNYKGSCDAVYFPASLNDVKEVLKESAEKKVKVTIAGNGTGLTGSRVPTGGIVLSTEKMNKIIEINKEEHYAVVEPGVILKDFQDAVDECGLFYPPDPTETNCFIGGTVATNASGAKTFKYGATRNYVEELEVVLPTGEVAELKRGADKSEGLSLSFNDSGGKKHNIMLPDIKMPEVKNASGFFIKADMDAVDLFIGSEGTLGVITKLKLKLLDKTDKIISCVVFFETERDGLDFVDKARQASYENKNGKSGIESRALEYFDGNSLKFLQPDFPNIPSNAEAAVWFEQEAKPETEDTLLEEWLNLIVECNGNEESVWFAGNEKERKDIHFFRHAISSKVNEYISHNNLRKLGTDVAVPDNKFREFYFYCRKIVSDAGINFVAYGHFGNSHIHLNMLPADEVQFLKGKELYKAICMRAVQLHGTVSAEHGIGKIKTDYLLEMYGEQNIKEMAKIKKALDPYLMLGIGNVFASEML